MYDCTCFSFCFASLRCLADKKSFFFRGRWNWNSLSRKANVICFQKTRQDNPAMSRWATSQTRGNLNRMDDAISRRIWERNYSWSETLLRKPFSGNLRPSFSSWCPDGWTIQLNYPALLDKRAILSNNHDGFLFIDRSARVNSTFRHRPEPNRTAFLFCCCCCCVFQIFFLSVSKGDFRWRWRPP